MSILILTTSDSGAGHLKQEKRADRILAFVHRLVTGPVSTNGPPEAFFWRRQALYERDGLFYEPWWFDDRSPNGPVWNQLTDICREHDRVELWIDPDPNALLVLLQLLDWLGPIPEIASRLWVKQSESPLGERRRGDWTSAPISVKPIMVTLARRAWSAFGAPTPEAWVALQDDPDLDNLPGLRRAIELMLNELPDQTGLGATERRILSLTERQGWWKNKERHSGDLPASLLPENESLILPLMQRVLQWDERLPLGYFEIGETLCELAAAPVPALSGVTESRFDLDVHQDGERFRRFRESPLSLTALGHRLIAKNDDWSRHNPIHRWWGGTRLTNDALWRWHATQGQLLTPR